MSAPGANVARGSAGLTRATRFAFDAAAAIERNRRLVLAAVVVAQWAGVLAIALSARHNGWLYYHGGDGIWYWTSAWALGHLTLPATQIGFGLAVFQAPVAAFLGPSLLSGLPFVLLLNTLVLLPLVPLLLYGIGERIAGRLFGLLAACLWLVLPLLADRGFRPDYRHDQFLDNFLPGSVGLNALGDFPSAVACLAVVYLTLRAIDTSAATDAVLAGTLAGFALAIKPSNALLLPAPFVGLVLARRFPQAGAFVVALLPAVVALALWKQRGLGTLPLFGSALGGMRLAAGALPLAGLPNPARYGGVHWGAIEQNLRQLREIFWSKTLLEWVAIAGTFGLLRRSFAKGAVIVTWFACYFAFKAGSAQASVYAGSFFRLLEPAYPAYVLLAAACIGLLAPGLRPRPSPPPRPATRRTAILAILVLGLFPLVFVAAARPAATGSFAELADDSLSIRVVDLGLTATATDGRVRLAWRARPSSTATIKYRVYRAASAADDCTLLPEGVRDCVVSSQAVANVRATGYVDRPGAGRWIYRVAVVAAWNGDPASGDPLLLSRPVSAVVR